MYAENSRICINKSTRNGGSNTKLTQVSKPSQTIFIAEQDTTTASQPAESVTTGFYAVGRHKNNTMGEFSFVDSMRAWLKQTSLCVMQLQPMTPIQNGPGNALFIGTLTTTPN